MISPNDYVLAKKVGDVTLRRDGNSYEVEWKRYDSVKNEIVTDVTRVEISWVKGSIADLIKLVRNLNILLRDMKALRASCLSLYCIELVADAVNGGFPPMLWG